MADENAAPTEPVDTGAPEQTEQSNPVQGTEAAPVANSGGQEQAKPVSGDGGDAEPKGGQWPENWRQELAGDDEKLLKRLERLSDPKAMARTIIEQDKKISSGQYKKALPDDPSPEELAAYRKENGIPEEATPEAYGIQWPEGYEPNEADQEDIGGFLKIAQDRNWKPDDVKGAWGYYLQMQEKATQQLYEAAQAKTLEYRDQLRDEFGREFATKKKAADNFIAQQLGDEGQDLAGLTLSDGTKLADHPLFVKLAVNGAYALDGDGALATAELNTGQNLEDAYREAINLKHTDPQKYHSQDHQEKLQRLASARMKRAS